SGRAGARELISGIVTGDTSFYSTLTTHSRNAEDMSLGPQCWECRWRRMRCDSQQPQCSKCVQKGLLCPGYSTTKPLRWRHLMAGQGTGVRPPLRSNHQAPAERDVAPSCVILDALTYYNAVMAPDLAADGSSSFYTIDISKWVEFNISKRHLTLCLVTLHRAVRKYGDVKHNLALYHYHQACAAQILSRKIQAFGQAGPDLELFEDVSLFFFSQIQASAYGAWKTHLTAAKTLFNLWGIEALMGKVDYEFFLCHLVLADVFGTSMAPASHISADDISQHTTYLDRVALDEQHDISSRSAIFQALQSFDPANWAQHRPRHTSSQAASWMLLATCFQSGAMLYLTHCSNMKPSAADECLVVDDHYTRLKNGVRDLYDLKQHGGVLYKYILWPMVVSGVEAVICNDEQYLQYLCELLEQTTIDLGTLSMREASIFLQQLWISNDRRVVGSSNEPKLNWDTIFACSPLFLM
ncbi:C6 zinc finger domain protein, partial [Stagonosporopsis vannaccii]